MSSTVVNVGIFERDSSGNKTTSKAGVQNDQGTVSVWVEGQKHTFGPGQRKAFADDGIASAVAAGDSRLRIMDSRDGAPKSNASLSVQTW